MNPLIDQQTEKFTRGKYEGKTIQEVADSGTEGSGYLYFIKDYAETDTESIVFVEKWLETHPEYQEE